MNLLVGSLPWTNLVDDRHHEDKDIDLDDPLKANMLAGLMYEP